MANNFTLLRSLHLLLLSTSFCLHVSLEWNINFIHKISSRDNFWCKIFSLENVTKRIFRTNNMELKLTQTRIMQFTVCVGYLKPGNRHVVNLLGSHFFSIQIIFVGSSCPRKCFFKLIVCSGKTSYD